MATSRYKNTDIASGSYYKTSEPLPKEVESISMFSIRVGPEDRLDSLAAKYLGSGQYWWVIAQINDIQWAWDIVPGQVIQIPRDIKDVLEFL